MGYAKKVKGQELKFRIALELGKTVEEIERTMLYSEYEGWREYFSTHPTIQEVQMAHLTFIQAAKSGIKNVKVDDFMLTKVSETDQAESDIRKMSADEINELLRVD